MSILGRTVRFELLTDGYPARVRILGPWSDAAIAEELYGDPTVPVVHQRQHEIVEVDLERLRPEWQRAFYEAVCGHPPDRSRACGGGGGRTSPDARPVGDLLMIGGQRVVGAGDLADFMRRLYHEGIQEIHRQALQRLARGRGERAVAIWVVNQRNFLKHEIRLRGPGLWRQLAEWRNQRRYGNPLGPDHAYLRRRGLSDRQIIDGARETSQGFNRAGRGLRLIGHLTTGFGFVLDATQTSPAAITTPLPVSAETEIAIERMRLRLGIPASAIIDRHGHLKAANYMQVDLFDPHSEDQFVSETEEILWYIGVPITYTHRGVTWTVPGRTQHPSSWWP